MAVRGVQVGRRVTLQVPESNPELGIRRLEKHAMRFPEERIGVMQALSSYASDCRGTRKARMAKQAVVRIEAVTMLEALSEDSESDSEE